MKEVTRNETTIQISNKSDSNEDRCDPVEKESELISNQESKVGLASKIKDETVEANRNDRI